MSNILRFDALQRKKKKTEKLREKAKGRTMCDNNHHKWVVEKAPRFDVKQGKLVTVERCSRCDATRKRLT